MESVAAGAGLAVLGERRRRHRAGRPRRRRLAGPGPLHDRRAGSGRTSAWSGSAAGSTPTVRLTGGWSRGRRCPTGVLGEPGRGLCRADVDGDGRSSWCCSSSTPRSGRTRALPDSARSAPTGRRPAGGRGRRYRTGRGSGSRTTPGPARGGRSRRRRHAGAARGGRRRARTERPVRGRLAPRRPRPPGRRLGAVAAGAGLAVLGEPGCRSTSADLDGAGDPHLVVLAVDNPVGQNGGHYRVLARDRPGHGAEMGRLAAAGDRLRDAGRARRPAAHR